MNKAIKKKALTLVMAGVLSVGAGGLSAGFSPFQAGQYAEAAVVKSGELSQANFVIDRSNTVFDKNGIQSLVDEQAKIHQKGDVAVKYDFYTYIYDSDEPAKDKAQKIADGYARKSDSVPFLFVLNKHDGSYHFVEDKKLAPYTSAAYLSSLAEKLFANGQVSSGSVKEFVTRADSTLMMSVDGDFAFTGQMPVNEKAAKEHITVRSFGDKAKASLVEDTANAPEDDAAKKADESSNGVLPAILAFVLAAGTILFFKKKRKKG